LEEYNMGVTVRQKVEGKGNPWHVFIHVAGMIRSKAVGEKRDAEAVASAIRRKLALGEFSVQDFNGGPQPTKAMPTFAEFGARFMKEYAAVALKRNTREGYQRVLKVHLLPAWGSRLLDSITRADVKALLLGKRQAGKAQGTVQNIQIVLSSIFTYALEDEVLTAHPAQRMGKFIRKGDRKKDVKPLTREQATAFLAGVQEHYPDYYAMFLCAFRTGLRFGELLGLKWDDVNVAGNFIEVQRSFSHGHMDTPKSKKSRRVDLSNQLKLVLLQHKGAVQRRFKGKLPAPVFPDSQGGHYNGDNVRHRVFVPLIEKLDVAHFRIHDIRHTFASQLLANGAPIVYVKEQMGHASIQTTVDIYGHLIQGANRNEVNRLDDANFGGAELVKKAG
jgi:integrase